MLFLRKLDRYFLSARAINDERRPATDAIDVDDPNLPVDDVDVSPAYMLLVSKLSIDFVSSAAAPREPLATLECFRWTTFAADLSRFFFNIILCRVGSVLRPDTMTLFMTLYSLLNVADEMLVNCF